MDLHSNLKRISKYVGLFEVDQRFEGPSAEIINFESLLQVDTLNKNTKELLLSFILSEALHAEDIAFKGLLDLACKEKNETLKNEYVIQAYEEMIHRDIIYKFMKDNGVKLLNVTEDARIWRDLILQGEIVKIGVQIILDAFALGIFSFLYKNANCNKFKAIVQRIMQDEVVHCHTAIVTDKDMYVNISDSDVNKKISEIMFHLSRSYLRGIQNILNLNEETEKKLKFKNKELLFHSLIVLKKFKFNISEIERYLENAPD